MKQNEDTQSKSNLKKSLFSGLALILWLTIELHYDISLDQQSRKFILFLQTFNSQFLRILSLIFNIAIPVFPIIILIVTVHTRHSKLDSFYSFTQIALSLVCSSIMKILLQYSRPYLVFDDILALSCECSYGNPSSHIALAGMAYFCLYNDLDPIYLGLGWGKPSPKVKYSLNILTGFSLLLETLIRMFLGTHNFTEAICAFLLVMFIFHFTNYYRKGVLSYLFNKFDQVRANRFAQIWSGVVPTVLFLFTIGVNYWVLQLPSRAFTPYERINFEKCKNCRASGFLRTSVIGMMTAYYIPGMLFCISLMSCQKSAKIKADLTKKQRVMRFIFNSIFRGLTFVPQITVFLLRFKSNLLEVHMFLGFILMMTPAVAFGFPGILLKKCGLEIKTDFIRKDEDPNEEDGEVVVDQLLVGHEETEEWDMSQIDQLADGLDGYDIEDSLGPESLRGTLMRKRQFSSMVGRRSGDGVREEEEEKVSGGGGVGGDE